MRRISVITGTRAEYGLLRWIIKGIHEDSELELQLLVTGMHLSPEFGLTYREIEQDGFPISRKIEILLSSDTAVGISKSIALAQISFAEAFDELKPEIIVVLGDRTEIFSAVSAALVAGVPVAHIQGGELTEGAYDNALRHCITKMSHLHFVATEEYRKRVIQMGEDPSTVFNVGAPGLDNIRRLRLLSRKEVERAIRFNFLRRNLLVTFHPVTLERATAREQFQELLDALSELADVGLIFTKPNSDKDGRVIIQMIEDYVRDHPRTSIDFSSLGSLIYLSAMKHVDAVVGNSSSGIIEAPSVNTPTVNIGDRQKGRVMGDTIICCSPDRQDIGRAIEQAVKHDKTQVHKTPYGDGHASDRILSTLKSTSSIEIKKRFVDITF